jgi:hypothetical protein
VGVEASEQRIREDEGQNGVEGNDEELGDGSLTDEFGQEWPPGNRFVGGNLITGKGFWLQTSAGMTSKHAIAGGGASG